MSCFFVLFVVQKMVDVWNWIERLELELTLVRTRTNTRTHTSAHEKARKQVKYLSFPDFCAPVVCERGVKGSEGERERKRFGYALVFKHNVAALNETMPKKSEDDTRAGKRRGRRWCTRRWSTFEDDDRSGEIQNTQTHAHKLWLSVNGRVQQERNVKHFTFQQQGSSRLDLNERPTKSWALRVVVWVKWSEVKWEKEVERTSGKRDRRSENRPGDCG